MLRREDSPVTTTAKWPSRWCSNSVGRFAALLTRMRAASNGKSTAPSMIGIICSHPSISSPTIAAQLALAAATELGQRTLVVDMSGPGSNMPRIVGAASRPGMTEILHDHQPADTCIVDGLAESQLSFVPWGSADTTAISSSEVGRFSEFLDESRTSFELVVVALPPATETSPGATLAACLDGVLLVIDSEKTNVVAARRAHLLLERTGARVLGAVLNNCRNYLPAWLRRRL